MAMNIALFGPSGSGKTTVANYLVSSHGYVICSSGDSCRRVCRLLFDSESKTLLNKVTDAMKSIDNTVWLKAALANKPPNSLIVFDSMRFLYDYDYLRNERFIMWRIDAPLNIRTKRLQLRGQEFNPSIDSLHPAETELDKHDPDYIINNNTANIDKLYEMIEQGLSLYYT